MTIHNSNDARKSILTLSIAKYLNGTPIQKGIEKAWVNTDDATRARFDNVGFDVDPVNVPDTLVQLRSVLRERPWDGVIVGWCCRGNPEKTELFEELVNTCVDEKAEGTKMMFCTGPTDLLQATLRSFP